MERYMSIQVYMYVAVVCVQVSMCLCMFFSVEARSHPPVLPSRTLNLDLCFEMAPSRLVYTPK